MSFSPALAFYRAATSALEPFAKPWLDARARRGKEDAGRVGERFGFYQTQRPAGRLIWLHAASVGESGVAMALIDALSRRDPALSFLLSTGTRTSAEIAARRAPPRTTHIYAPLDLMPAVRRFVAHWRPDLGVFVESEIWPNLILEARRARTALALVNARMSPKTLANWRGWSSAAREVLGAFAWVSAADARTGDALTTLRGSPTPALGNLKLAAPLPRIDPQARAALALDIGKRPVWVAASTHAGEDEIVLEAHARVRANVPSALLILAPRHPERGAAVAQLAHGAPRRSAGRPIGDAPVYIADTMGEMGLFYDLAPISLIAGSLLPELKGHNPVEPARLGSAVLSGPNVELFQDLFDALFTGQAALRVDDAHDIAVAVTHLWRDEATRLRQIEAARAVIAHGAAAFDNTVTQLLSLTPAHAPA
ncbi:MAG: 3-deoxy-D-manno-octulosonic acid transferase [Terricaulis sp.]